ncbi:adenylate/guanylate cyclase domain-containing protein [Litoribacillus peritrichatus]|uniref:Adenylate/guanylate cyclase domain-containing protein n=1 Tax=Litoribacillus peritrichatus TaxID=718191 RepID=A0ABP7MRK0_9GAMM
MNFKSIKKLVRLALSLLILLVFLMHVTGTLNITLFDALERFSYDVRLKATAPNSTDNRIVIVDIDEKSLQAIGQWPWNRDIIGKLTRKLTDTHQAKTVSFDMVFAEKDTSDGIQLLQEIKDYLPFKLVQDWQAKLNYDQQFTKDIVNRPVILGYVFNQNRTTNPINALPAPETRLSPSIRDKVSLITPSSYTGNLQQLQQAAAHSGFFDNPSVDPDGIYRKVPLIQMYNGGIYPSLALATYQVATNSTNLKLDIQRQDEYLAIEGIIIDKQYIPTNGKTEVYVPYRGRQNSYPYLSAEEVLTAKHPIPRIKDKIVLIGTTAPGLLDLRSTPLQKNYPGVEVHANLISGILDGTTRFQPSYSIAQEFITILIMGLILIFSPALNSPIKHLILATVLVAGYTAFNMFAWNQGIILQLANPLMLVFCLIAFQTAWGYLVESRAKRHLAKLFSQYIPKEIVSEMAKSPESFALDGESREMTVLFTDIRGFTNISEGLEPKELAKLMSEYLTPMTRIIHKHNGTIDKYMGDAIMAFWGAPITDERHHYNAIHAAEEMIEELTKLNQHFKQKKWPRIEIGIGINTGTMDVGNMGSEFRMAYTVLGDSVNLGSRLEGLTKSYGVDIIIGEETRALIPEILCRELDRVKVKGKDRPVSIYEPIGHHDLLSEKEVEEVNAFNEMLLCYRAQDWNHCLKILHQLIIRKDGRAKLYKLYVNRIRQYQKSPPEVNWDGVFVHTDK